jgi:hypothetical protein
MHAIIIPSKADISLNLACLMLAGYGELRLRRN